MLCSRFAATAVKASDDECGSANDQTQGLLWRTKDATGSEMIQQNDNNQFASDMSDPLQQFSWITGVAPCFSVDGNKIKVLSEPAEFFETLKVRHLIEFSITTLKY